MAKKAKNIDHTDIKPDETFDSEEGMVVTSSEGPTSDISSQFPNQEILSEEPFPNRAQILEETADEIEEIDFYKDFVEEELEDIREALGELMVKLDKLDEERKEQADYFKSEMLPVKNEIKKNTIFLREGKRVVREKCFKFIDQGTRKVRYYDKDGEMVKERDAFVTELQTTIFSVQRGDN